MTERTYSVSELARDAGCSVRMLKRYIELGLVDRPHGRTRAAFYTDHHLRQTRAVLAVLERNRTLAGLARSLQEKRRELAEAHPARA